MTPEEKFMKGLALLSSGNAEEGIALISEAAEAEYPQAQTIVAGFLFQGVHGFEKNEEKAVAMWRAAAEGGDRQAMYLAGVTLFNRGDWEEGLEHMLHAAELGMPQAAEFLQSHHAVFGEECHDEHCGCHHDHDHHHHHHHHDDGHCGCHHRHHE